MQQAPPQEQVGYASLGMRFAAVLVDTLVLFGVLILIMTVYVAVLAAQGKVNPSDPTAAQEVSRQIAASSAQVDFLFFGALFVYYAILEAIFSASVGKLVFGMRVVMRDGSRATGLAVVIRNLVRIPEAMLLYIPAGLSYLASPQRQRLGDHAARTVVIRRSTAPVALGAPPAPPSIRPAAPLPARPPPAYRLPCRRRPRPPARPGRSRRRRSSRRRDRPLRLRRSRASRGRRSPRAERTWPTCTSQSANSPPPRTRQAATRRST